MDEASQTLIDVEREIGLRGSLHDFVEMAWPIVEPGTAFHNSWYLAMECEHLEAVSRGQIRKLMLNVPPGTTKSLLTSVFWPAWDWIHTPKDRFINASFDANLTLRDARRMLLILRSQWYQERWGNLSKAPCLMMPVDCAATDFSNLQGGWRFSTSVEGKMTGRHCDIMIVDDPIKPQDVSKTTLDSCKRWWHETVPSRFGDQKTARRVMIMQRLHEDDLAGVAMKEDGWEVLRLPMRFEKASCSYTSLGGDMRTEDGQLLDPVRFPEEVVKQLEKDMGSRVAAAQLQQRPAPATGAIFQRGWFKHYKAPPARFEHVIQSWDAAFKDTDGSDYVCGQVWGVRGGEYFLLDQVWDHLDMPATCAAIESTMRRWPKGITKLVEDKANGPAIIQTLKKKVPGLTEVTPEGGKESRANAVAPLFEAGNVWFPDPEIAPWVDDFEQEMVTFPFAAHDDRVDACTQALLYLHAKTSNYAAAMKNAKSMFGYT
jgi:predicted phage terminase large subunit-like protein